MIPDNPYTPRPIVADNQTLRSYRGEPWTFDGRFLRDRDGVVFAEVFIQGEELAHTAVWCVNLLAGYPLRQGDGEPTQLQELAMLTLLDEARRISEGGQQP